MHELSIVRNIVAIVVETAEGRPVSRVTLEIGKLSGVMSDALAFCFEVVARGTAVEGAELEIHEIDGRARCRSCGAEFETDTLFAPCLCGSRQLDRLRGEELKIKSIEVMETV
jgi:hydrogenase nickel incorporation protein HypA/HybF